MSTLKRQTGVFKFLRCEERVVEKLRFRDGLVWTVGLTVEIKPCFQISLAYIYVVYTEPIAKLRIQHVPFTMSSARAARANF